MFNQWEGRVALIGVNNGGGRGGRVPPRNHSAGDANVIRPPPRFWPLKTWKTAKFSPQIHQNPFFRGSAPNPAGGAYSAPLDPLAGGEGARCPLSKNPTPALSPSGFELRPFGPRFVPPLFGYAYGSTSVWESLQIPAPWLFTLCWASWSANVSGSALMDSADWRSFSARSRCLSNSSISSNVCQQTEWHFICQSALTISHSIKRLTTLQYRYKPVKLRCTMWWCMAQSIAISLSFTLNPDAVSSFSFHHSHW